MRRERITERVEGEKPLIVDREAGIIRGVKILGRESKNGRVYRDRALADACRLYHESHVNIDHVVGEEEGRPRAVLDGFGVIRNPTISQEGVFGDLHYLTKHPLAPLVEERAEKFPRSFGLSHVAFGEVSEGTDGVLHVESLEECESVDIVSRPATNAGLFESEGGHRMADKNKTGAEKKTKPAKQILESNKSNAEAATLLKLIEMDDYAGMGEAPVEVADTTASPEAQVKGSFKAMIVAVLDDDSLDNKAKAAKIKKFLDTQEKLLAGDADTATAEGGDGEGGPMAEALKRLENAERKLLIREALEDREILLADLNESQRKCLDRCKDKAEAVELLESFNLDAKAAAGVGTRHSLSEAISDDGETADDLVDGLIKRHKVRA